VRLGGGNCSLVSRFAPERPLERVADTSDVADAPIVVAAVAGRAEAIVSGDQDQFGDAELIAWLAARERACATFGA
jgi:hypothetical protein